ncbi:hypothetical protein EV702DRAFT_1270163 [Suillus placidus]|uniref:J domain-containing protein n=1 Tax=Suillus placidus TaxID=48579 RepID=A0A9P6ZP25_9AGAM|nr:hypothetical protein EV702DRAFT_1270163 [Suillus placidus]
MTRKKNQAKKKQAQAAANATNKSPPPSESPIPQGPSADDVKEQGNVAFKAKQYTEAIELYTKAIGKNTASLSCPTDTNSLPDIKPTEPSYFTNRAASYMALKRFRSALSDCQQAATLQSEDPSSKTLIRLARCQLALGLSEPALSTLRSVLSLEPTNPAALQLKDKVLELENHLRTFESSRTRKEWGMARLALDKCLQSIEAEGGEIPTQWRLWRVELELSRGSWDAANIAANDALRLDPNSPEVLALRGLVLFLTGKLSQALQHVASALRLDPGHEPAHQLRKRVKDVERLKEEGNTAFKGSRLQDAIARYTEALDRIGEIEEEGKGGQIRATLLSNRATTLVKLDRYEEALLDTEASLALYSTSFKALRTRARINLHLEKYDAAIVDFRASMEQAEFEGVDADVRALRSELKKAEAALKRSKTKDYYNILGIAKDCTELEIKKAYRRESLKHHPDKGGEEEKFKLVAEAHAVLSDPQRRERYDMGEDEDGQTEGGMGGAGAFNTADLAEIFSQFHGGFGGGPFGGGQGQGGSFHFHSGGHEFH